jgi:type II secretory pathway pseudopilin PulG
MYDHHHASDSDPTRPRAARARGEGGYALIALLALMTIMMIMMMAAAPSVRHQSRRELEAEAIARGEEVAEAIRAFFHYTNRLPTSMEELQEGAPFGTKKLQVLRASAARDPLTESGEWRLIKIQDREFIEFIRALVLYSNGGQPQRMTKDNRLQAIPVPQISNVLDLGSEEEAPGGEDSSATSKGPFVGVASRSRRESVIAYYGIERHDKWVFTPLFR